MERASYERNSRPWLNQKDGLIAVTLALGLFVILFLDVMQPGVTWDEAFVNFDIARRQAAWLQNLSTLEAPFSKKTIAEYWQTSSDHPSLPRSLAAMSYILFTPLLDEVAAMRLPSIMLFSLLAASIFFFLRCWLTRHAALAGALSLALMPRIFGHAHFFSLDVPIMAMWFWCAAGAYAAFYGRLPAWVFGLVYALTFTTKLHAVFLPFPLLAWAVWVILVEQQNHRVFWKRVGWMAFWAAVLTPIVYIGLQPWLWHDTWSRIVERFFGYATKTPIHIYYFGERYSNNTPWHYPLVLVGFTIPATILGFTLMGGVRPLLSRWPRVCTQLIPAAPLGDFLFLLLLAATPLVIILLPLAQGYDGVRLFLPAFPFFACLAGWGFDAASRLLQPRLRGWPAIGLLYALLMAPSLLAYAKVHPAYLAYYNEAAGGVKGARELGMETTYWCEALTREFLQKINETIPPGGTLKTYALPYELIEYYQSRGWLRPDIGYPSDPRRGYHLIQFRQGFFVRDEWGLVITRDPVAAVEIDGVPLVALYAPFE